MNATLWVRKMLIARARLRGDVVCIIIRVGCESAMSAGVVTLHEEGESSDVSVNVCPGEFPGVYVFTPLPPLTRTGYVREDLNFYVRD